MARALEWTVSITAAVALYALPLVPLMLAGFHLASIGDPLANSGGGGGGADTGDAAWQEGVPLLMMEGRPDGAEVPAEAVAEAPPTPPDAAVDPTAPATTVPTPPTAKAPKGAAAGSPDGSVEGTSPTGQPGVQPGSRGRRSDGAYKGTGSGTGEGAGSGPGKCEPTNDPRIRQSGRDRWEIDRAILDEYAKDWVKLDALGGAWPHEGPDGQVRGIKLRVDPCYVGYQGGMRTGDIVRTVGGRKINSVPAALATWLDVRNDDQIVVVFVRRGELLEYTYRLRK